MAKISVIIPVYNVEKYLERCMASVMNQTLSDLEIIMVDDGSPDNCPKLCDDYAKMDSRIKVIHKQNAGLGMARNSGLEIATGEYVAFVDSDDYIELDAYEKIYARLKETNADICVSAHITQKDSGEKIPHENPLGTWQSSDKKDVEKILLGMLGAPVNYKRDCYIGMAVWKCVYSNKVLQANKIRFKSEREFISEDIIFQLTVFPLVSSVCTIKEALYYYCENGASTSLTSRYDPKRFERYRILYFQEVKMAKESGISEEAKTRAARMFLGNTRGCIKQIVKNDSLTKKEKEAMLKQICRDDCLQTVLKEYPRSGSPYRQRVYNFLLKHACVKVLFQIVKK